MKFKSFIVICALFVSFSISISSFAKKVGVKEAKEVGKNFYYQTMKKYYDSNTDYKNLVITNIFIEKQDNNSVYYVFNINKKGFVIVAADDIVYPILGYSFESSYGTENQPPEFKTWMKRYKDQIIYFRKVKATQSKDIKEAWNSLGFLNKSRAFIKSGAKIILPLLTSTWDQGTYYNEMCPSDAAGPDGYVWAGCVATAMAQVMYYWKYPLQGTGSNSYSLPDYGPISANFGSTTYDWTAMPNNVTSSNSAVAELIFHCGVSVDMYYSPDGSGANVYSFFGSSSYSALPDYFKYSTDIEHESKSSYSTSGWENLLKSELDNKRPMLYSGSSSEGGHAFVCDGYDASDNFHFNWGWSGYNNGYFYIESLNPGSSDFNSGQEALLKVYPGSGYPYYCSGSTTLTSTSGIFDDGSGPIDDYQNNSNCEWLIDPTDIIEHITLSFDEFNTESSNDIVKVYDGANTTDPLLGTFSGSSIPSSVSSTGDKMLVTFTTNSNTTSSGWKASYTSSLPVYCSGTDNLTNASGSFGDGSGVNNYNNSTLCRWDIKPVNATSITIDFTSFDTEDEYDFVKIYDLESTYTVTYSGHIVPADVVINSGSSRVLFKTNASETYQGWNLSYTSTTDIAENEGINGLQIYPNPTEDKLNIKFVLRDKVPDLSISILNILGEKVYSESLKNFEGKYNRSIDLTDYQKGIYLLQITSEKGSITKKIVVK